MGDVNASYLPAGFKQTTGIVMTGLEEQAVKVNEPFTCRIVCETSMEMGAMTLFLGFDASKVEVLEVQGEDPELKFIIGDGKLSLAWSDTRTRNLSRGETIITLTMKVKEQLDEPLAVFRVLQGGEFAGPDALPMPEVKLSGPVVFTHDLSFDMNLSNHPNPFRVHTSILYLLPENGMVTLRLTNLSGAVLNTLVGKPQTAGSYSIDFSASDISLPAGVYIAELTLQGVQSHYRKTIKLVVTR